MVRKTRVRCLLAVALLSVAPSGLATSVSQQQRHRAVVEELLSGPKTQAQIVAALQAEREFAREESPHSLRISLANVGLPVPPEVRDLAAKVDGRLPVTAAEADHATKTINQMLQEQHIVLDHKVIDCREKRRNAGEDIQDILEDIRALAAETSSARSIIVEATSRIPQDRRSFQEFKAEAQISRVRCESAGVSDKVKAASIARDAVTIAAFQQALKMKCGDGGAAAGGGLLQAESLLQLVAPEDEVDDVIAEAEKSLHEVDGDQNVEAEPMGLSQSTAAKSKPAESLAPTAPIPQVPSHHIDQVLANAESTLHGHSAFHAKRTQALKVAGCPAVAAALGVVARKRGGAAAAAFLQDVNNPTCKLTPHTCAAMHDVAAEVAGEIADSRARLRSNSAQGRQACQDEELFAKNQLSMETGQASDRSRELGEATWKAGDAGDMVNQKDSERQKLQAGLKATTAKCAAGISDILYGKMCALQKVRDSLQILAGRTELPEDCQVTDWDEGICSATCGGGMKTLTRKVSLSAKDGAACPPLEMHLQCGQTACPKDCEVSRWSGWSACSARCDGGVQERNRDVVAMPVGNGVACPHLVDMRLCNSEACTSECELLQWTGWSSCSHACGGGSEMRSRGLRDEGKSTCPANDDKDRLEFRECNKDECDHDQDVKCAGAPMDMVVLVDASGSMTASGFAAVKDLTGELARRYNPSKDGTKVSIAAFAKEATAVSGLSDDAEDLSSRLSGTGAKLHWLQGPSNAGAGLARAASLLAVGGRKTAKSVVLMLTDGRLVDPYLARKAADRLKNSGVRLVFGLVGTDWKKHKDLIEGMASAPEKDNIIQLPGLEHLPAYQEFAAKRIIMSTCSAVEVQAKAR